MEQTIPKQNTEKRRWPWLILMNLFFALLCAGILYLCRGSMDLQSWGINAGIFLAMMIVIWLGCGPRKGKPGLYALERAACAMRQAASQANSKEYNKDHSLKQVGAALENAECPELTQAFAAYENSRTKTKSDLHDYLNEDLLCRIGNVQVNNLVGSALTGLGILGTFIGLMAGLQGFGVEAITQETAEAADLAAAAAANMNLLIQGIKTAFLTSIAGVILSILYNFGYRCLLNEARDAMETLLQSCTRGWRLSATHEEVVTQNLVQQTKSLQTLETELADRICMELAASVPPAIAAGINEAVKPQMEQLIDRVAEVYDQNMQKISADFLKGINEVMKQELEDTRKNVETLSLQHQKASEKMQAVSDRMTATEGQLKEISDSLSRDLVTLRECEAKLTAFREERPQQLTEILEAVNAQGSAICTAQKKTCKEIVSIKEETKKVLPSLEVESGHLHGTMKAQLKQLETLLGQFGEIRRMMEEGTSWNEKKLGEMQETVRSIAENQPSLERLTAFGAEIQKMERLLAASQTELLNMAAAVQQSAQSADNSLLLQEKTAEILAAVTGLKESTAETGKALSEELSGMYTHIRSEGQAQAEELRKIIEEIQVIQQDIQKRYEDWNDAEEDAADQEGLSAAEQVKQSVERLEDWVKRDGTEPGKQGALQEMGT